MSSLRIIIIKGCIKENMSPAEDEYNKSLFEETVAAEFPEEDMRDKHFRDKVWRSQKLKLCRDHGNIFRTKNMP